MGMLKDDDVAFAAGRLEQEVCWPDFWEEDVRRSSDIFGFFKESKETDSDLDLESR